MYSELTKAKPLIWCMYVCLCQWRYHLTSISVELGFSHSNDCFCAICQLCITGRDSFTLSPQAVKSCQTPGGSFLCLPLISVSFQIWRFWAPGHYLFFPSRTPSLLVSSTTYKMYHISSSRLFSLSRSMRFVILTLLLLRVSWRLRSNWCSWCLQHRVRHNSGSGLYQMLREDHNR